MAHSGDPSAQPPQIPAVPQEDEQPMIEQDASPAAAADEPAATNEAIDEAVPDEAPIDDATTQIVPQAQLTPPPSPSSPRSSPRGPSGSPRRASEPSQPGSVNQPHVGQPGAAQWQGAPHVVPVVSQMRGQRPPLPGQAIHAPWHTASSWGATTFVITAETAAGFSYLFWWVSGLLVYFNERENRYVRFHAVQSILLTGALSIFSVIAFTIAAVLNEVSVSTHQSIWGWLALGVAALSLFFVLAPWLAAMIAAWTGTYLQLPVIGDYAERFAAPPIQLRP